MLPRRDPQTGERSVNWQVISILIFLSTMLGSFLLASDRGNIIGGVFFIWGLVASLIASLAKLPELIANLSLKAEGVVRNGSYVFGFVAYTLILGLTYGETIYAHVPYALGGGQPYPVKLTLRSSAPDFLSDNRWYCLLIEAARALVLYDYQTYTVFTVPLNKNTVAAYHSGPGHHAEARTRPVGRDDAPPEATASSAG